MLLKHAIEHWGAIPFAWRQQAEEALEETLKLIKSDPASGQFDGAGLAFALDLLQAAAPWPQEALVFHLVKSGQLWTIVEAVGVSGEEVECVTTDGSVGFYHYSDLRPETPAAQEFLGFLF